MIQNLIEKDLTQGIQEITQGKSVVSKVKRLSEFVQRNEKYFIQMLFLVFDCFRQKDGFKEEKRILRVGLNKYRDSIQEHLGFPFKFSGTLLLAITIGLLVQKIIDPKNIKIDEIHNEGFDLIDLN